MRSLLQDREYLHTSVRSKPKCGAETPSRGVIRKGEKFVGLGEVPTRVGFVIKGLFSQNYVSKTGDDTIKYFFPEGRFAASVAAMLDGKPSRFSIVALENTEDSREPLLYDGECQQGRRASPHLSRFSQSTYLLLKP